MCNTADISAINTMRDFSKITMFLAANGTLAASILVTFAYQVRREGGREGGREGKREGMLAASILITFAYQVRREGGREGKREGGGSSIKKSLTHCQSSPTSFLPLQVFSRCPNQSLSGCSPDTLYLSAQVGRDLEQRGVRERESVRTHLPLPLSLPPSFLP
jgi:hypothetical protein